MDIPGTVSQILWHFTGGPTWNGSAQRQNRRRKTAARAHAALLGILRSRQLRLGAYREVVNVQFPKLHVWDKKAKKFHYEHDVIRRLESSPVCCVADIPIVHLGYHEKRYGKFAIGFHRAAAVRSGFNPVFYTLQNSAIVRKIRRGLITAESINVDLLTGLVDEVESGIGKADVDPYVSAYLLGLRTTADDIGERVAEAKDSISKFTAFIKTFDAEEFSSVYCEREWRSVDTFNFAPSDIAMIVLPRAMSGVRYFESFVTKELGNLDIPSTIPVVPWETLLEH